MGFAESLMSTGERIMHREKQHWFVFVWGARFTILALFVGIILAFVSAGSGPGTLRDILSAVILIIFVVGLAVLLWTVLQYLNREYVITNRRVLQVSGVLNKASSDSSLEKINDARLEQSFVGRIFGFGDLDIMTAAEVGIERFRMIKDPIEFKKAMLDAKHEFEIDMQHQSWPPSPPARASGEAASTPESPTTAYTGPVSTAAPAAPAGVAPAPGAAPSTPQPRDLSPDEVTRTLANLADLRDRGAISLEEYEAKKADLLGRI